MANLRQWLIDQIAEADSLLQAIHEQTTHNHSPYSFGAALDFKLAQAAAAGLKKRVLEEVLAQCD